MAEINAQNSYICGTRVEKHCSNDCKMWQIGETILWTQKKSKKLYFLKGREREAEVGKSKRFWDGYQSVLE